MKGTTDCIDTKGGIRSIWFVLAIAMLILPGCAQQNVKDVLTNLDKDCVRHYAGAIGTGTAGIAGNATVTFQIDCQPSAQPQPPNPVTP